MKKKLFSILCLLSLVGCNGGSTSSSHSLQNSVTSSSSEVITSSVISTSSSEISSSNQGKSARI